MPFLLAISRWEAMSHLLSGMWLRSITVPVVTVKSLRHSFSAQRYQPGFLRADRNGPGDAAMAAYRAFRPAGLFKPFAGGFRGLEMRGG